jgi:hypothetical protein
MGLDDLGRTLVVLGIVLAVLGGILLVVGAVPGLGRLPGDISIERGNFRIYAPLATCLLLSLLLTIVLNVVARR